MRFKDLLHGDFPEKYRKIYMERAKKELAKADKFVKVDIQEKKFKWSGDVDFTVVFSWNIKNNFFQYYNLLNDDEKDQLKELAKKALQKIDAEFDALEGRFTPQQSFDIRIDYSLLFAATHNEFRYRFMDWIKKAVRERYNYLNSREYLKTITTQQAARQFGDDVKNTLELLRHLKAFDDLNESTNQNRYVITDIFYATPAESDDKRRIMDYSEVVEVTRKNNVLTWFKVIKSDYAPHLKPHTNLLYEADTGTFNACAVPEREFHMNFFRGLKDGEK